MTEMDLSAANVSFWDYSMYDYTEYPGGRSPFQNEDYKVEHTEVNEDGLNKSLKITYLTIYSLVFVLGVLGNGVVIWVTGFKMKKTINTVWYLNLAVVDFLVAAFLPLTITQTAMDDQWPFGKFMCKMNGTVFYMNMFASIYILVIISVDRCVCVVWPVWAQNHRSVRKASWVSLGVWFLGFVFSPELHLFFRTTQRYLFYHNDITYCFDDFGLTDDYSTHARLLKFRFGAIVIAQFVMGIVIPFTVIVSCYSVIIYRLRRNRSLASPPFKIIAAVITTVFLCWAPIHIMNLIWLVKFLMEYDSATLSNVIKFGFPMALCLAFLKSCLNPLLYVFMRQDFKDDVLDRALQ